MRLTQEADWRCHLAITWTTPKPGDKVATQVDAAREAFGERLGHCRLARRHRPGDQHHPWLVKDRCHPHSFPLHYPRYAWAGAPAVYLSARCGEGYAQLVLEPRLTLGGQANRAAPRDRQ